MDMLGSPTLVICHKKTLFSGPLQNTSEYNFTRRSTSSQNFPKAVGHTNIQPLFLFLSFMDGVLLNMYIPSAMLDMQKFSGERKLRENEKT